ncbi:MAG: DUF6077 domain-containing protein, partial [Nitrospira sp.]|nr:DUF6077 domain-containing protein [Nitrospira sp.]
MTAVHWNNRPSNKSLDEHMMHLALTAFLIFYSGWTIAVHLGLLLALELQMVMALSVVVILALFGLHRALRQAGYAIGDTSHAAQRFLRCWDASSSLQPFLISVIALPVILYWSWNAFWIASVLVLVLTLLRHDDMHSAEPSPFSQAVNRKGTIVILLATLLLVVLSYAITRSDLDDAFYAAVAASASSTPAEALKRGDPMLGEIGLSLILPSYRFVSFELLSGAGGYLFSVPAMDFYYVYFLPVWVAASVVAIFLLTSEFIPRYWVMTGCLAIVLTLLLGEMHRSPANFAFVRLFQGKAVFLSALVPAMFYLTARFTSDRGTKADLLLLGCCQISAVGLTHFGMLMGPIAGFSALISNALVCRGENSRKFVYALAVLFLPLPYLLSIAAESAGSSILELKSESAADVWLSVFGSHQQFLMGMLLLAGPALAKDSITRWRLAIPPLILYAVLLNPVLSECISKYVTTTPVYWRVVWSFPIVIFAAISLCLIIVRIMERGANRYVQAFVCVVVCFAVVYALPFHTLTKDNVERMDRFAEWKISQDHLRVSEVAMELVRNDGRLLAPDEVAGVVSRFENHPRLVSTRGFYLPMMKSSFSPNEYEARTALYRFVIGKATEDSHVVRDALRGLNVAVIVLNRTVESTGHLEMLNNTHF